MMEKTFISFKLKMLYYSTSFLDFLFLPHTIKENEKNAPRESTNLAPKAKTYKGAVIQAYKARIWGWKGFFADHTWIAIKKENADSYTVYEVLSWLKLFSEFNSFVRIEKDLPDRLWFGNQPHILLDLRGSLAEALIDKIHIAAIQYPYPDEYSTLGPNSNTFTQWIASQVPELNLKLPSRAIGKNYMKMHALLNREKLKKNVRLIQPNEDNKGLVISIEAHKSLKKTSNEALSLTESHLKKDQSPKCN